jgi:phosphatidylserine decarboxylase
VDSAPVFEERLTSPIVPDAFRFGAIPFGLAVIAGALGSWSVAGVLIVLTGFVLVFFRNPERAVPDDPDGVVAPADGRVIEVGEIEEAGGQKSLRIGIFLSIFDVHVNRMPVAGRVVAIERSGSRFLAAFDRRAEHENVRLSLALETRGGLAVRVVQITGLVARRIVCQPQPGQWVEQGTRYGLIRFGSRTDVVLPASSEALVRPGQRVRGGRDIVARLPGEGS